MKFDCDNGGPAGHAPCSLMVRVCLERDVAVGVLLRCLFRLPWHDECRDVHYLAREVVHHRRDAGNVAEELVGILGRRGVFDGDERTVADQRTVIPANLKWFAQPAFEEDEQGRLRIGGNFHLLALYEKLLSAFVDEAEEESGDVGLGEFKL